MTTRGRLAPVVGGTLAVAAAYGSAFLPGGAPAWAPWAMVAGIALLFTGMMALGAARQGRGLGALLLPLGFTFAALVAGFGLALALPGGEGAGSPLRGGVPTRAALVLYGVGILPALVLPLAYALTFRTTTLDQADLDRIRAARRPSGDPGAGDG